MRKLVATVAALAAHKSFTNQVAGTETLFTRDREGVLREPSLSQGHRAMHIPDNVRFAATYGVFDPQEAKPIAALTLLQGDTWALAAPSGRYVVAWHG